MYMPLFRQSWYRSKLHIGAINNVFDDDFSLAILARWRKKNQEAGDAEEAEELEETEP